MIRQLLHGIYAVYVILLFVLGLLIIFPGLLVDIILGNPKGGNLVIHLCRFWSDWWMFAIGFGRQSIVIEPIDPNRHYVFVANHTSYLDIPVMFQAIRKNSFRILGKIEMSKIPVFGSLYKLAVVLVDRSSTANRAKSIEALKRTLDQNISILIFPEGTFNETGQPLKHFFDGAFRIAIETGTPIKPTVFLDTSKLMHFSSPMRWKPGISRVVILPEVAVEGLTIDDLPSLKQKVHDMMEAAIIKYR